MKNTFTSSEDKIINESSNRKVASEVAKVKDTKKETGRSTSGGGKSVTANTVAIDYTGSTFMRAKNNAITKRHKKNKVARKSRRINKKGK